MVDLWLEIKQAVETAKLAQASSLLSLQIKFFEERYNALRQQEFQANPLPENREDQPKKRVRIKQKVSGCFRSTQGAELFS